MTIAAKAIKGREYFYNACTAHKVPERNAQKVVDILNGYKFKLKEGETWHLFDVSSFDNAYWYAETQRFTYGKNGVVKRRAERPFYETAY